MAFGKLFTILFVVAIAFGDHEIEKENKAKKAVAPEKGQEYRRASLGKERGSFHKLSSLMNRTEERRQNRRNGAKSSVDKIHLLHKNYNDTMMNDNEGIAISRKTYDNHTFAMTDNKIKKIIHSLRPNGPMYETVNRNYVSQATGVFCNFENTTTDHDMCLWQWNSTVSSHGLGFRVETGSDLVAMNQTTRGIKFTGPTTDADGNPNGTYFFNTNLNLCIYIFII